MSQVERCSEKMLENKKDDTLVLEKADKRDAIASKGFLGP